jgi:hypothetical protein
MDHALILPEEERVVGATDEFAHLEATFDLSYDVAKWLECVAHFFNVRFLRDEHGILTIARRCLDLRRFALLPKHEDEHDNFEDIKEQLIFSEMSEEGGREECS